MGIKPVDGYTDKMEVTMATDKPKKPLTLQDVLKALVKERPPKK